MAITNRISLILMLLLCIQAIPARAQEPALDGTKELQRIRRQMQEKKKELKRADRKERSILTELDRIDREVQAGKAELADQQKALLEAEVSLRHVEQSNSELSKELSGLKQMYGQRLRALYKMSKNGYAAGALAAEGPGDSAKRIRYLSIIAERDQALIQEFGKALASLSQQQADMTERKQQLLERRQVIKSKKTALESRKKRKALILASVREQKNVYEHTLRELEESSASLWAMVKRSEQERPEEPRRPAPRQPAATGVDANRLPWPLEGRVLTRFGMQRHPQFKTMVFRRGIEISAREGDAVHAVSDGKVAFADWYKGYGRLMIIEHGPGFYTLYGNLSRLDLNKGDQVVKGQVVGLAGDTGSLQGSKLYFEMRRNGEAQDPLLWLARR
jgi:septal ring factor EnvC (AmiA/AmiB activator)